jgi:hypothetical protein
MRGVMFPDTPWQRERWEIPAAVSGATLIWRDGTTALGLTGIHAYSDIVEFTLTIWRRQQPEFGRHDLVRPGAGGGEVTPDFLRVGVIVADGRTATNLDDNHGSADLVLAFHGGFGGPGGEEQRLRMWPLPPPGPFALVVEWPVVGLAERRVELDARAVSEAAARVVPVWPDATSPAE